MLLNVADYEKAARRRLPKVVFEVISAGAADEVSLRRNRRAFERLALRPRALGDVTHRDLRSTVLGTPVSMPLLLDPCGFTRMAHRDAELAVSRAATDAETICAISTVTSYSLEDIASVAGGPKWFQLYPPADRHTCLQLIERARSAGYVALCVTIDGAMSGLRESDKRNGLSVPLRMTPRLVRQAATRPRWALDFLCGGAGSGDQGFGGGMRPASMQETTKAIAATARAITPDEIAFIRRHWDGPLVIKGVQRADECPMIVELGVDGIVVSNHGGRQLDGVLATIEMLPEIVSAVGGAAEVFIDGGFRRGTDIVKALALGARAVLIGRPYIYGLAVAGEAGVTSVLDLLRTEIDQTLALLGVGAVRDLDSSYVQVLPGFGCARARSEVEYETPA